MTALTFFKGTCPRGLHGNMNTVVETAFVGRLDARSLHPSRQGLHTSVFLFWPRRSSVSVTATAGVLPPLVELPAPGPLTRHPCPCQSGYAGGEQRSERPADEGIYHIQDGHEGSGQRAQRRWSNPEGSPFVLLTASVHGALGGLDRSLVFSGANRQSAISR